MINDRVLELLAHYLDGGTVTSGRWFLFSRYPFLDNIEIGAISIQASIEYANWMTPGSMVSNDSI